MVSGKGAKRVRSSSHLRHEMCGNVNIGQVHTSDITTTQHSHNDIEKRSVLTGRLCPNVHVIMFLLCRYNVLFSMET